MSEDVEDRRGSGGGGFRVPGGRRAGIGCGGFLILFVLSIIFKQNFFALLGSGPVEGPVQSTASEPRQADPQEERLAQFVSFVLDDVQATWTQVFQASGQQYQRARLVLFTDAVDSACGYGQAAMGPFYCPGDGKVYIDLGFYRELQDRFGAPGDFAQAYVIAHEIGHHVQGLLGIDERMRRAQAAYPDRANELSIALELQADCFAGVWGHSTSQRGILEKGDVEEGLNAAAAVGDDRMQRQAGARVSPENWTHGSSAQRAQWFRVGLQTGDVQQCATFGRGRLAP